MSHAAHVPGAPPVWRLWYVVAAYAAIGLTWIVVSDSLVLAVSTDPAWMAAAQRYKGVAYVVFTALALWLVLRAGYLHLLRALAQAQSRELQVQDLFLRHPQPMWLYDCATLAFLRVNEAAQRRYGYSEAEFLGMTLRDIRPAEDVPPLEQALQGPQPPHEELAQVRHLTRAGQVLHVKITSHAVTVDGRAARMVMAIDVTSEVLSRRALQRQESQFRQLHQSLGEVLWLTSADARDLLYVSPAFETIYGQPVQAFKDNRGLWLEAVLPEDRPVAEASDRDLLVHGQSNCEYRIRRPDGSVRWISDRKKLVMDEEGLVQMIGGIAEDITAGKERDAAQAQMQAELERLVAQRTAELERANAELDAFTRTAAHDLKSPLNAVSGFSGLLRQIYGPVLGEQGQGMLLRIEQSAQHMASLVNDLLSLSRVSTAELHLADVDLARLARELLAQMRQDEPARDVLWQSPDSLVLRCDPGLVRSLLSNLLGNAWKFSARQAQARLSLSARTVPQGTELSIADNGVGFDASRLGRSFKPFERFHSAAEFEGTGIGLVTCQRIVARHGGELSVTSSPGQGTVVCFTLPQPAAPAAGSAACEPVRYHRDTGACVD